MTLPVFGAGFLGIEVFNPPWDIIFLPLFNALVGIYQILFTDLALAIIVLTLVIRTLLAPLFVRQIRSSKEMQQVQPLVREVQRKHKGNPRKIQEETQAIYREHGVSPFAGCLPSLVQLVILLPMYQALIRVSSIVTFTPGEGTETAFNAFLSANPAIQSLGNNNYSIPFDGSCVIPTAYHAFLPLNCQLITPLKLTEAIDTTVPWLGGINLAVVDSVFAIGLFGFAISGLAILAAALQFVQVRMTMARNTGGDDPTAAASQTMVYLFPIMTIVWGALFPAGLMLYWITYTAYLIVQQYFIVGWGNLFPILGWQPRWAPAPEAGLTTRPRPPAATTDAAPSPTQSGSKQRKRRGQKR
jgi:YidC/Oxa1 family membrane protein insertase